MKKNRFRHLVALILLMCCTLGYAQKFEIDGLTYNVIDESNRYVEVSKVEDTEYTEIVKIPSTVTRGGVKYTVTSIGEEAFEDCYRLRTITIPSSVTSIGEEAFRGCEALRSITIPSGVTSIGAAAFWLCSSLTSITIPSSVTSIGVEAFSDCSSLTQIKVAPDNPIYDSRNNCNAIIETKSNTLIAGCPTTTIPSSVTSIGDGAFYKCSSLTSITIPSSVTSIGVEAFGWCYSLTSITIPSSVTSIGEEAFRGCEALRLITIPNSVSSIRDYAFWGCSSLTTITLPKHITNIDKLGIPEGVQIIRSTTTDNSNQESKHFKASTKPTFNIQYDEEPESHFNQGLMYHNAKKYNEAFEHFKKAAAPIFQFTPAKGEYAEYINAAYNHIKNGDMTRARQTYNIYKDLTGKSNSDIENCLKAGSLETKDGHAEAQFYLGLYYYEGYGVSQNYAEAVKWYRKAAEQGYAKAQFNLGVCYYKGYGVPQNYTESVKWFRKAAEQGLADAQYNLGTCYDYGEGVPKDYTEAVKWYRKAAEQGDAGAQYNLGLCYKKGEGVPKDNAEAVKWWVNSALQGYEPAKKLLKRLGVTW